MEKIIVRGLRLKAYHGVNPEEKVNGQMFELDITALIDAKTANGLFHPEWPIYTRTNDSCPTQYFETAEARKSVVSNGCLIEGSIENCVVGRGTIIKKGAVVKNAILLPGVVIGADAHVENVVVDKNAKILHAKKVVSEGAPGYIRRNDVL